MTHAQGHEMAGEGEGEEATEHDVSTTAESNDPNSESQLHTVEEGDGEDFDDMMEQLLEGERAGEALLDVVVGRADLTAASMDTEDTINDSQMMSRDDSQYVEGGEEREGGEEDSDTDSSHSQETEGSGAEEEDMEENEEEEGEEEDDEDDDDGGSDAYDDEPDEFQDLEDAFFRMPGTGNAGNGGTADHDNVMMIGHVNDDPLLEDRAISLPLWGDMAGGENGSNEGNGTGAVTGASGVAPSHPLLMGRSADALPAGSARAGARSLTRQRGFRDMLMYQTSRLNSQLRQYIQLNPRTGGTAPGTPAILQSLLGHNSGREFLPVDNVVAMASTWEAGTT